MAITDDRVSREREFHDDWADSSDISTIDVVRANEVCTAPEMRHILHSLGDLHGKKLLDIGCGLGEASVYFALKGANVTSSDLSSGMLEHTKRLAADNGVRVATHLAQAEDMSLAPDQKFDIIYAGNLLHHIDIEQMLTQIEPHLEKDGVFVSWDPIAYNPVINLYRMIATQVRTPDERPLTLEDMRKIKTIFPNVKTRSFWLTTLIIFILMFVVQRRNPNKERYWKAVISDGDKWAWLYMPLARLDTVLLAIVPPLRWLCWNIVVVARK